jgi:hypothetical protein
VSDTVTAAGSTLRTAFAQAEPALRAASARLWDPSGLRPRYAGYLEAMYGVLRASVPLMKLAARRSAELDSDDQVADALHRYYEHHIAEELGHDEWLRDDIALLRESVPSSVWPKVHESFVATVVGPQYYWIEHRHPAALLGYIVVLESNAPSPRLADWIVDATGLPRATLRTVHEHAAADPGHTDDVFRLIDSLPLTPDQQDAIRLSGLFTIRALVDLYQHLVVLAPPARPVPTRQGEPS